MNNVSRILKALSEGHSTEIEKLYNNNFFKIKSFVLRNNGKLEDAQDVFQNALLQITARYINEPFEIKSNFDAYLFTVCKNLWRRELNKGRNRVTIDDKYALQSEEADLALSILEQQRWELFQESLLNLSENCKEVLKLFFNKIPYKQIVIKMNYNSETVARQRIFKCKNKLIEIVKKDKRYNELMSL